MYKLYLQTGGNLHYIDLHTEWTLFSLIPQKIELATLGPRFLKCRKTFTSVHKALTVSREIMNNLLPFCTTRSLVLANLPLCVCWQNLWVSLVFENRLIWPSEWCDHFQTRIIGTLLWLLAFEYKKAFYKTPNLRMIKLWLSKVPPAM